MEIRISKGKGSRVFGDACAVRLDVFVREQGIPEEVELDELDPSALHLVAYESDEPAGTSRLVFRDGMWLVGRVAVIEKYRGTGLGRAMMMAVMDEAVRIGASELHLHAQVKAAGFYEKLGFQPYGEPYDEEGIDHISMKIILPR
jgi:predicted GNAT family N-acyltransferase